jgi:hypothetical protein
MKGAPERKAEPAYSTDQSLKSSGRVHNRPAAMDRLRAFSLAKGAPRGMDESINGLTGKFSLGRCWSMTSKKLHLHREKARDTRDDGLDHWSDDGDPCIDDGPQLGAGLPSPCLENIALVAAFAYISKPHFGHDAAVDLHPK